MSGFINAWEEAEFAPPLGPQEVHVWHIRLDLVPLKAGAFLSADEQARASRYRFEIDRSRFASCRAKLRQLLGQYVGESPQRLIFEYGAHGKPALASPGAISFNVSHSGDHALFAFAGEKNVGVDIECLNRQLDFQNLADRFMSAREAAHVRDAADKSRAFYGCWTRKEAWLKAIGCGLSEPLSRFDTSSALGHAAGTVACEDFPGLIWTLYEITPSPDLAGAVAVEGLSRNVRTWRQPTRT